MAKAKPCEIIFNTRWRTKSMVKYVKYTNELTRVYVNGMYVATLKNGVYFE